MAGYDEAKLMDALSVWGGPPTELRSFKRNVRRANRNLDGGGDFGPLASLERVCRSISEQYVAGFGYQILSDGRGDGGRLDAAQRILLLGQSAEWKEFLDNPDYITPSLPAYGEALLQLIATNRTALIAPTEQIALDVLKSGRYEAPEGTTGYFIKPSKLGVFALEMLAAMRGETIDWESFHVPPDRFWLDCARVGLTEPDPGKAAEWAKQLCDAHMQTLQTDKENFDYDPSTGHEIDFEAHFLWPITVHAFLRLRAQLGLQTGGFDHPLMNTSFSVLKGWDMPAGAWLAETWFTEILDKVVSVAPDLKANVDLIR